jgi:hypothetical protein
MEIPAFDLQAVDQQIWYENIPRGRGCDQSDVWIRL